MTGARAPDFAHDRAPATSLGRPLLAGLLIAIALVGAYEATLRALGGRASVALTPTLWATQLHGALNDPDPDTTVILGASRSRGGFSSAAFQSRFPGVPIYRLSTSGESPVATLRYLARNTDFAGTILIDFHESWLETDLVEAQQYLVDHYEGGWTWNVRANGEAEAAVGNRVVLRQQGHALAALLRALLDSDATATIPYWNANTPRYESLYDFTRVTRLDVMRDRVRPTSAGADPAWFDHLAAMAADVRVLRERGASVAFVRFPTGGLAWRNDGTRWPRDRYWDRLVAETGAVALHFMDDPRLAAFDLPDLSHVDQKDRDAFTAAILDRLVERGMAFRRTAPGASE